MARHRRRLGELQQRQQRGRDIGELAVAEPGDARRRIDQHQRHAVQRMGGVRPAGHGVAHHLGIAVVGGHQHRPADMLDRALEPSEAAVDGFDGGDGGGELAGMADHVGIGVVHHREIESAALDRRHQLVGHLIGRHLGLQIIGCDLGRGDQDALLAGEGPLLPAVEEEGDMGVLLGLGDAQLVLAGSCQKLAQRVAQILGGEQHGMETVQLGRVFAHAQSGGEAGAPLALEAREIGIEEGRHELAHPVGAEIGHQQPVAVAHAVIAADRRGLDELIALAALIAGQHRRIGARGPLACCFDQSLIGQRQSLPALVAVHGVIASAHGGDRDAGRLGGESGKKFPRALRRGIAPVEEGVDQDLDPGGGQQARQRRHMGLMGMDAAGREQAHQMAATSRGLQLGDEVEQSGVAGELAGADGGVDARQLLHHHPAGADVHMADLGIAHLALGQAHMQLRGVDQGVGRLGHPALPGGRLGQGHGIAGAGGGMAPAVQNAEHDGLRRHGRAYLAAG